MKRLIYISILILCSISCVKNEMPLYNKGFVYLSSVSGAYSETVNSLTEMESTYYFYLSSKKIYKNIDIEYSVKSGAGLKEGIDYILLSPLKKTVFMPGIYRMPLRIRWLPHKLAGPDENNTLIIEIKSAGEGINIGFPGPNEIGRRLTIIKKNL